MNIQIVCFIFFGLILSFCKPEANQNVRLCEKNKIIAGSYQNAKSIIRICENGQKSNLIFELINGGSDYLTIEKVECARGLCTLTAAYGTEAPESEVIILDLQNKNNGEVEINVFGKQEKYKVLK